MHVGRPGDAGRPCGRGGRTGVCLFVPTEAAKNNSRNQPQDCVNHRQVGIIRRMRRLSLIRKTTIITELLTFSTSAVDAPCWCRWVNPHSSHPAAFACKDRHSPCTFCTPDTYLPMSFHSPTSFRMIGTGSTHRRAWCLDKE